MLFLHRFLADLIKKKKEMFKSEPVNWRTQSDVDMVRNNPPVSYTGNPLATALSLLISLSLSSVVSTAQAAQDAAQPGADSSIYSIESGKSVHGLLLDVTHAGTRLVTVGERGHILYSDDQGKDWTQAKVPSRQLLTALYFVDDKHGWAVGHDAQILASSDGGAT